MIQARAIVLERRLSELNREIRYLRFQQTMIVEMLRKKNPTTKKMLLDKQVFVTVLKQSGLDDAMMDRFHSQLEKNSPDSHQFLLEFLGIGDEEIETIRKLSR